MRKSMVCLKWAPKQWNSHWKKKCHLNKAITECLLGRTLLLCPRSPKVTCSIRYKASGANAVDSTGRLDTVEFINIAKDDALAWPKQARRAYPSTVNSRMQSTVTPFVRKSLEVNNTLLDVLNDRLGLPAGMLLAKHPAEEFSGSEARVIRNSPIGHSPVDPQRLAIGSHTDFGSLVGSDQVYMRTSGLVFF